MSASGKKPISDYASHGRRPIDATGGYTAGGGGQILAYGAREVWLQLMREGIDTARCSVERLMRELGLLGGDRGRKTRTTIAGNKDPSPLDLVHRRFCADRPNQLWVADFSYVAI